MTKFDFKKKLLSSAVAVAMVAGVAMNQNASAIHLAEDGIGQVLVVPHYRVENGYSSEFTIVNSRSDAAVKVRVAIRNELNSREILDFVCYMTPTDVCRFELVEEGGRVVLKSTDDSLKTPVSGPVTGSDGKPIAFVDSLASANAVWASQVPLSYPLPLDAITKDKPETPQDEADHVGVKRGHVEIVAGYAVKGTVAGFTRNGTAQQVTVFAGMSKYDLAKIFDTPRTAFEYDATIHVPGAAGINLGATEPGALCGGWRTAEAAVTAGFGLGGPGCVQTGFRPRHYNPMPDNGIPLIRSTDPSWVQLRGMVTIRSVDDQYSYRIPALAGSMGDTVPTVNGAYVTPVGTFGNGPDPLVNAILGVNTTEGTFDGLVISNPVFDVSVALPLGLGQRFGMWDTNVRDKVVEIERAMAFTSTHGEYKVGDDNMTAVVVTFPTRYQHEDQPRCRPALRQTPAITYPPFMPDGRTQIGFAAYDDFENTKTVGNVFSGVKIDQMYLVEGNYFTPSWPEFKRGWYSISPVPVQGCDGVYPGSPGLALTHLYKNMGGKSVQSMITPNSHKPMFGCADGTDNLSGLLVSNPGSALDSCYERYNPASN